MIAVNLIFVGIALFLNGFVPLRKLDKKNLAVINALIGFMIIIFNMYLLMTVKDASENISHFGGLLFGFTNLYLAANTIWEIDTKTFGVFCLFGTICAVVLAINFYVTNIVFHGTMWVIWSLIWLFGFIGYYCNKNFQFASYIMFMLQGIFTTFGLGFLMLLQIIVL